MDSLIKKRVIFCGTPKIASKILEELINIESIEIVAVISQPDRPVGRKKILSPTLTKQIANLNNLKVLQPEKIKDIYEDIVDLKPDYMVTCAYGQIIPEKILSIFKNCINVHASLLPKYRGGAPIQYAIWNGETETGISLMKMIKKMDAGEVYIQEKITIQDNDNTGTLFEKMSVLGQTMIKKYLCDIFDGKLIGIEQEEAGVTFSPTISSEQENINWNQSAFEIRNQVRALYPSPIAHTIYENERWKIGEVIALMDQMPPKNSQNGQILEINKDGILVKANLGLVLIKQIQRPGKKMTDAFNFIDQKILKINHFFE